jgi:hypothetical protein
MNALLKGVGVAGGIAIPLRRGRSAEYRKEDRAWDAVSAETDGDEHPPDAVGGICE